MSPDFNTLTSKQKKVYTAIESFIKVRGIPPTVREIGEMVGEKTPGAVQGILNRLEQKGVIKREMGMARSIKLVLEDSNYVNPIYVPEIKKINKRNSSDLLNIYNIKKYHPLSPDMLSSNENAFLVESPNDGQHDCPLRLQDMLLVSSDSKIDNGDLVLAVYENCLLLRKQLESEDNNIITLKSDSSILEKQAFKKDEVIIVGKVMGKLTKFK